MRHNPIICILLLLCGSVPGVMAEESYGFVAKWGTVGSGDGQFEWPSGIAVNSAGDNESPVSKSDAFTIDAAPPAVITSVSPTWIPPPSIPVLCSMTVTGTGFKPGAQFWIDGPTTIQADNDETTADGTKVSGWLSLSSATPNGSYTVYVQNPGESPVSKSDAFTIDAAPSAVITSVSPTWIPPPSIPVLCSMTVTGTGFKPGAQFWIDGPTTIQADNDETTADGTKVSGWLSLSSATPIGSYTVYVQNPGESPVSKSDAFTIDPAPTTPTAAFSAKPDTGPAPLTVQFTDRSTGSPTSWSWTFGVVGREGTSSAQNPTFTYTAAGTYTVVLTVSNALGSDSETKKDYITVTATSPAVIQIPTGAGLPTDTNTDGLFDDVNGNGRADFADVVLYFNQMTWIAANEPVSAFDYNGNGRIDFADVVWLFNNL